MKRRRDEPRITSRVEPAGRFGQEASREARRWLVQELSPDELLLGWLALASVSPVPDVPAVAPRPRWHLLVTDRRAALVASSRRKRPAAVLLSPVTAHVSHRWGRAEVQLGRYRIVSQRDNDELVSALAPVLALDRQRRIREVARASWRDQGKDMPHRGFVVALLRHLAEESECPLDELGWLCLGGHIDPSDGQPEPAARGDAPSDRLGACLQRLIDSERSAGELARWAEDWRIAVADKRIIVERLGALGPQRRAAELSLPLRRQLRDAESDRARRGPDAAAADVTFARHLHEAGFRREAKRILEERLALLAESSLDELSVEPAEQGVRLGGPLAAARRDLLSALAAMESDEPAVRASRWRELASLEPLTPERVEPLCRDDDSHLARRAKLLRELLAPGALAPGAPSSRLEELSPIDADELEARLPHPAARDPGVGVQIQQWLGRAQQPDYATIKSYSERATAEDYPALLDALADATLVLGVDGVEGFVSRGDRRLGVRAHDSAPPFLVIGADHLDEASDFYLHDGELRFAVASEVAHLRFGYTRLTSSELWDGVLYRGKQALDVAAMLAGPLGALGNLLRGAQQVSTVERVLRQVGMASRKAASVLGVAKEIQQVWGAKPGADGGEAEQLDGTEAGQLLAACRAMQLGADRAGLLLAGDLRSAVRAVFLSTRAYAAELRMAERHGLSRALSRRDAEGGLPQPALSLRLASLCAFYLSDDYQALRRAMTA